MTAYLVSEMYTAAGLKESMFLAHTGSSAGSAAMLYMTPQKYRQTRSRNGISWLMSCARADPGHEQRGAHVERGLQQQRRKQQQPVPGERLARAQHDGEQHHHGQQQLLELHQHVRERQASTREMQRADQRDIRPYYRGADHDRPLGEGEYENAGDQISRVIADALVGL